MKTAILLTGTSYNFRFSIQSLMDNLVIPNDADVFVLTSRCNVKRRAPTTAEAVSSDDPEAWAKKAATVERDTTQPFSQTDLEYLHQVLGGRLKALCFLEDMPDYEGQLQVRRQQMMDTVTTTIGPQRSVPVGLLPLEVTSLTPRTIISSVS